MCKESIVEGGVCSSWLPASGSTCYTCSQSPSPLQPSLGCQLMRDWQSTGLLPCLPVCPRPAVTTIHRWRRKRVGTTEPVLFCSSIFNLTLSPHWRERNRSEAVFVFLSAFLKETNIQSGFRIFTKANRSPSPLDTAWGLTTRTILSIKVRHVYLSCDCVRRDKRCMVRLKLCCNCLLQFSE